jgi:hypothetical protein
MVSTLRRNLISQLAQSNKQKPADQYQPLIAEYRLGQPLSTATKNVVRSLFSCSQT